MEHLFLQSILHLVVFNTKDFMFKIPSLELISVLYLLLTDPAKQINTG